MLVRLLLGLTLHLRHSILSLSGLELKNGGFLVSSRWC